MTFLKAGADATTPRAADPRFALYERQGVMDKTGIGKELTKQMNYQIGSDAVKTAGQVVSDVYTGVQIAGLEKDINEQAVNPFLRSLETGVHPDAENEVAQSQLNIEGMQAQNDGIFAQFGKRPGAEVVNDLNASESGIVKEGQKLNAALKQGRMTQQEFELRLRKVTREAINRNPGLTKQLLAHAQLVEHQSGVRLIADPKVQLDKAEAKQAAEETKLFIAQAKAAGVYVDPTKMNDPNHRTFVNAQVESRLRDVGNYDEVKRMHAAGEIAEQYTQKEREQLVPSTVRGAYAKAVDSFTQMAGEATSGNETDKKNAIANMYMHMEVAMQDLDEELNTQKILPSVRKSYVDGFKGQLERTIKNVEDDVSGKRFADILGNTKSQLLTIQENNVLRNHDVASLDLQAKMGKDTDFVNFLRNNGALAKSLQDGYANLMKGTLNEGALQALYERNINPSKSDASWLVGKAFQTGNNEAAGRIIESAKQMTVDFADKHFAGDVEGKVRSQWDIIREIGKLKDTENVNLSTPDKASFTTMTRDFLNYAGTRFSREIAKLEEDKNVNVITRFGKDGRMVIEAHGAAPGVERDLNTKYANAFNDAVQAFAAVNKNTWAASSEAIVRNYAEQWQFNDPGNPLLEIVKEKKTLGSRGQNENNPLNLKEPGKNVFQSFGNREEGVKAAYKQLQSYKNGTSAAVGNETLDTPAKMLAKWNNAAEKGSANDNVYLNNVKAYSGLSDEELRSPVNNKDTWVDLIYGMARAEGNKKLTRNEIRNAIGD
jgi:hypothetical protein